MKVKDIMNTSPVCCTAETTISEVAKMMVQCDCGAIPVVIDSMEYRPVVGIVTDRDIVCRLIALDKNPSVLVVGHCMTSSVAMVNPEDSVDHCCDVMERLQVRRLPVVDSSGKLVGMVTQAHIAKNMSESKIGEMLKNISRKTDAPSRIPVGAR